jgi:hypothetical protein
MDDNQFDGLIRALGQGSSRRGALGLLAAAAGLGLREVSAKAKHHKGKDKGKGKGKDKGKGKQRAQGKPPAKCTPNKTCAQWCASTFGAGTAAASACTSDAAHCAGLCFTCGPAAPSGHPDLCGQTCCSAGQP